MSRDRLEEQVETALQDDAALDEIAHHALESIIGGAPSHNGMIKPD